MTGDQWLLAAFAALKCGSTGPYAWSAIRGATVPLPSTWAPNAAASSLLLGEMVASGSAGVAVMLTDALTDLVLLATGLFWYRRRDDLPIPRCDWWFMLASFAWLLPVPFVDSGARVLCLCGVALTAYLPTVLRSWSRPDLEPAVPYAVSAGVCVLGIMSLPEWSFVSAAYLSLWLLINVVFVVLLPMRRLKMPALPARERVA